MPPLSMSEFTEALASDICITITLENSDKIYKVQRTLLRQASPWFEKALTWPKEDEQKNELRLYDTSSETADQFVYWLLTGKKPLPAFDSEAQAAVQQAHAGSAVQLWIFGDMHFLPKLQDIAMKSLYISTRDWRPDVETIATAYLRTADKSKLRKYMMTQIMKGLLDGSEFGDHVEYSPGMLAKIEATPGLLPDLAEAFATFVSFSGLAPKKDGTGKTTLLSMTNVLLEDFLVEEDAE